MASLLLSLKNGGPMTPMTILQEEFLHSTHDATLPAIFEKLLKIKEDDPGFSLNEIVALGNQIQYTKFSSTAVQNWVKRDVKEILGPPQKRRKYSIDQMTILFIVEDLKAVLDFESIRKCLRFMFNDPSKRNDDLINPVQFYEMYSEMYEQLKGEKAESITCFKDIISQKAESTLKELNHLSFSQKEVISHYLAVATLAVHVSYVETIAKQFYHATLLF